MDMKPSEIIILVVAFAIPVGLFAALTIPGIMTSFFGFVFAPGNSAYVFGAAAMVVAAILGYRIFRRVRPSARAKTGDDHSITGLFRNPNK